jgi:DNA polymerase-3 subunit delta'
VSWDRVRGHEALIEAFRRAVVRGRLAHAYLFAGPAGVGKRLFAVELAKALLCETAPAGALAACDHCPACVQVEAGTHPDFATAGRPEESHEFPLSVMQELCHTFALKPARGRRKVIVLDDADDLNEESTNCFLKTLEEPPAGSVLILVGTSVDRQLPTILSRCQIIRFAPLVPGLVGELLRAQGVDDPALLERLVRLGGGSPGLALSLADPALWQFRRRFVEGLARAPVEGVGLAKAWMEFVEEAGKEGAAQRRRAKLVLRLLLDFLGDALALSLEGPARRTEPEDQATLTALAGRAGPERLLALLERCLEGDEQIDRRVQLVLALEALVDALARILNG